MASEMRARAMGELAKPRCVARLLFAQPSVTFAPRRHRWVCVASGFSPRARFAMRWGLPRRR
eukprot:226434-Alexandrium_andersonii.AAC.1